MVEAFAEIDYLLSLVSPALISIEIGFFFAEPISRDRSIYIHYLWTQLVYYLILYTHVQYQVMFSCCANDSVWPDLRFR